MASDSIRINRNENIIQDQSMKIKNISSGSYVIVHPNPHTRIK